MLKFIYIYFFISIFLSIKVVFSEEVDLGEISISANLSPTNINNVGSSVTLITKDEIENNPYPYFIDFIQNVPGVSISQNGPKGSSSSVFIRGLGLEYVKVLVDGINYGDVSSIPVVPNVSGFTLSNVDKIEVLKGSQSSLYGSSAIGGVISILTNNFDENGKVNFEIGSYNTVSINLSKKLKSDKSDNNFYISQFSTKGFSAKYNGEEPDGYQNRILSIASNYYISDSHTFFLNLRSQKENGDQDGFQNDPPYGFIDKNDEVYSNNTLALKTGLEIDNKNINRVFETNFLNTKRFYTGPFEYEGKRNTISYIEKNNSFLNPIVYGVEIHDDKTSLEGIKKNITQSHVFGEYYIQRSDRLDLILSGRVSNHSSFGTNSTGRISTSYKFQDNIIGRGSIGTGYRSPSMYELFAPFGGNENLLPENSITSDIGIKLNFLNNSLKFDSSIFKTEINDKIIYDLSTFGYAQSSEKETREGIELFAEYKPNSVYKFSFSSAHINDEDGNKIRRVPMNEFTINALISLTNKLKSGISIRHVNGLEDGEDLPDFTTVALKSTYNFKEDVNFYLRAENIFDEDYQTIADYSSPGRSIYFGLSKLF